MSILVRAKKANIEDDKWELVKLNPSYIEVLQKLDLLPKTEQLLWIELEKNILVLWKF